MYKANNTKLSFKCSFILFLVTSCIHVLSVVCQHGTINIKRELFATYDPLSRPVENGSQIINICAGLYVLQIVGLSEKSQIMQANIQLVFIWNDTFLKWNPKEHENVTQLFVRSSMIWTPDIIIMDSAEEKLHRGFRENYLIIVNSNGKIRWHYQTLSKSFCEIDIVNFPFDEQKCSIKIRSSARDKNMLRIIKRNLKVKVMETIKTEWFIINSSVSESSLVLSKNSNFVEYTVLNFEMTLRRVTTYYFLKIIIPFTIIASITLFTFWLAPVLLSLVFYLQIISDYIPRGFSRIPILTLFTLTNFSLVFLSCAMTVIVLRFYYKPPSFAAPSFHELPYHFRLVLFKYIGPIMCLRFECRKKNEYYADICKRKVSSYNNSILSYKKIKQEKSINHHYHVIDIKNKHFCDKKNSNKPPDPKLNDLLKTLKTLNKSLKKETNKDRYNKNNEENCNEIKAEFKTNDPGGKGNQQNLSPLMLEKMFYYEEWKQASLILDRLFFYMFLICMPMTAIVFFRTNILEYIYSNGESNNKPIPNINC